MSTVEAARPEGITKQRPLAVWLISGFFLIGIAGMLTAFAMIFFGVIKLSETQLEPVDYLESIATMAINLGGVVTLFRLKRSTCWFWLAALALSSLTTLCDALAKSRTAGPGASGLGPDIFALAMFVSLLLYSKRLAAKGILD